MVYSGGILFTRWPHRKSHWTQLYFTAWCCRISHLFVSDPQQPSECSIGNANNSENIVRDCIRITDMYELSNSEITRKFAYD